MTIGMSDALPLKPWDLARVIWMTEPCARTLTLDLLLHLRHGYVFSTPSLFLMGRAVRHDAAPEQIVNPEIEFGPDADAWMVYCATGVCGLDKFLDYEPYPLPFIGWERDNQLRFWPRERLIDVARRNSRRHRLFQGRDTTPDQAIGPT